MIKKIVSLILCVVLVLGITGCGNDKEKETNKDSSNSDNNIQENNTLNYINLKCTQIEEEDGDTQIIENRYNKDGSLKSVTNTSIFYEELTEDEKAIAESQAAACSGNIKCSVNFGNGTVEYVATIEDVSLLTDSEIDYYDLDDAGVGYSYDEYKEMLIEWGFTCE